MQAYVHLIKEQRKGKLSEHGREGILLAHEDGMYRVMIRSTKQLVSTKHVLFNEHVFPMKNNRVAEDNNTLVALGTEKIVSRNNDHENHKDAPIKEEHIENEGS